MRKKIDYEQIPNNLALILTQMDMQDKLQVRRFIKQLQMTLKKIGKDFYTKYDILNFFEKYILNEDEKIIDIMKYCKYLKIVDFNPAVFKLKQLDKFTLANFLESTNTNDYHNCIYFQFIDYLINNQEDELLITNNLNALSDLGINKFIFNPDMPKTKRCVNKLDNNTRQQLADLVFSDGIKYWQYENDKKKYPFILENPNFIINSNREALNIINTIEVRNLTFATNKLPKSYELQRHFLPDDMKQNVIDLRKEYINTINHLNDLMKSCQNSLKQIRKIYMNDIAKLNKHELIKLDKEFCYINACLKTINDLKDSKQKELDNITFANSNNYSALPKIKSRQNILK